MGELFVYLCKTGFNIYLKTDAAHLAVFAEMVS